MKSTIFTTAAMAMLSVVSALPVEQVAELEARQSGINANDLKDGNCAGNVFIFARGSTEIGNMVSNPCSPTNHPTE